MSEFNGRVEADVPLANLTSFGLGGPAGHIVHPVEASDLGGILRRALECRVPVKVLGGGANVLVRDDGFDGLVIRLDDDTFRRISIDGERVYAGAGADLGELVRLCSRLGLAGLEGLAGIPGTVGGAICMNAGGRYGEIGQVVETVEVVEANGRPHRLTRAEVGFAYRHTALGDALVTGATLRLQRDDPAKVYARFKEIWLAKTRSQPMGEHSAGCIFTNPPGESAGRLIDLAGLKGLRCGGARVSPKHANFIIGERGATAGDVLRLIDCVREVVRGKFGTELELEIDIW